MMHIALRRRVNPLNEVTVVTTTKIEWCDAVWNPVTGCTKVSSGCKNCYAEAVARRFWGNRKFGDVQCHEDRLLQPMHWHKPRRIFVNSMSDLFHEDVPPEFIDRVLEMICACPQHTFIVLTKRAHLIQEKLYGVTTDNPLRELGGGDYASNLWLGVSVENQETADERIPILLKIPAAVHCVSAEPLLGPISLRAYLAAISWLIIGGESGPKARVCHVGWIRELVQQAKDVKVPVFVKQLGASSYNLMADALRNPKGGDPNEWPKDLRVREWPEEKESGTHRADTPHGQRR